MSHNRLDGNSVSAANDLEEERFEGDAGEGAFLEGSFGVDEKIEDEEGLLLGIDLSRGMGGIESAGKSDVSVVLDKLFEEMRKIFAGLEELLDKFESEGELIVGKGLVEGEKELPRDKAERLADGTGSDLMFSKAKELIEKRFGVAEAPLRKGGD